MPTATENLRFMAHTETKWGRDACEKAALGAAGFLGYTVPHGRGQESAVVPLNARLPRSVQRIVGRYRTSNQGMADHGSVGSCDLNSSMM